MRELKYLLSSILPLASHWADQESDQKEMKVGC